MNGMGAKIIFQILFFCGVFVSEASSSVFSIFDKETNQTTDVISGYGYYGALPERKISGKIIPFDCRSQGITICECEAVIPLPLPNGKILLKYF